MPQAPLASKEASLFRQVIKNYEQKQHKKGIKATDQILRKRPDHGDTQAMKALILNTMGSSDEGFALAKLALKNDMKSHVCWHVYGLLYRSQKNYEEAIKAYRFALNLEPESPQILRDLSLLQVQMRDYSGYAQSRMKMLQKRESVRQNWTALAVAHHLNGDLVQAEKVLSLYEGSLKMTPPKTDVEHNEALMYKNTIIAEMGETERALEHLESIEKMVLDRTALMELRAHYLLRLGRKEDAEKAYRALLARNAELRAYYEGLEQAMGLEKSNVQGRKEIYEAYAKENGRLDAAQRIPLDFLEGDDFREAADQYLRRMLRKGVPSTFNNVKSLYFNTAKRKAIEDLVLSYDTEKQTNGDANGDSGKDDGSRWERSVLYFLAQHYNYKLCRDLEKAVSYTDKLIDLAPKTYDWYMTKARVYKHTGNPSEAAKQMNHARELDTRDRYINTKCAKYQLRDDENEQALKTMSKFTRNEVVGGTLGDLIEMQALWYLTEDGEAHLRQSRLGLALKRFHTIYDIFETWHEDQFDFHTFSLRKAQIRAYIDMIRWEDRLREHPYFIRPALAAIKIYLALYDQPDLVHKSDLPNGMNGSADPKAIKKARIEEEKKESERKEADRKAAAKKANLGQDGELKKSDQDPKGRKLVETQEPLAEAMKFVSPLLEFSAGSLQAQLAGFEVYIRRKKYYLALKCLLAAFDIDASNPAVHAQAIRFRHTLSQNASAATEPLTTLITSHLPTPYNTALSSWTAQTATDTLSTLLSSNPRSLPHTLAYARTHQILSPSPSSTKEDIETLLRSVGKCEDLSVEQGIEGIEALRELGASSEQKNKFAGSVAEKLGLAKEILAREASR